MGKYIDAIRCKSCGKIYPAKPYQVPKYCHKCGNTLLDIKEFTPIIPLGVNEIETFHQKNTEHIVSKKIAFWWIQRKERGGEDNKIVGEI